MDTTEHTAETEQVDITARELAEHVLAGEPDATEPAAEPPVETSGDEPGNVHPTEERSESVTDEQPLEPVTDEPAAPDEPPLEQASQAPPAEPFQGQTEKQVEATFKAIDRAQSTWRGKLADLMGEDFIALTECELCLPGMPGYHFVLEMQEPLNEVHERLLEVLRTPLRPDYVESSTMRQCPECQGWGQVTTGSRVPGKQLAQCGPCLGTGHTQPQLVNVPILAGQPPAAAPGLAEGHAPLLEEADAWGSPRILESGQENPNYGKMPQYKDANLP